MNDSDFSNPFEAPKHVAESKENRLGLITEVLVILFLLIFVFVVGQSTVWMVQRRYLMVANLFVFYSPILLALGWYIRKRATSELNEQKQ